jgi:hypothetical protein
LKEPGQKEIPLLGSKVPGKNRFLLERPPTPPNPGFLTGVTRMPFTAFVLVVEMTDHHVAIFPIMLSALAAELVARPLSHESFYEWARKRFMPQSRPVKRDSRFRRHAAGHGAMMRLSSRGYHGNGKQDGL